MSPRLIEAAPVFAPLSCGAASCHNAAVHRWRRAVALVVSLAACLGAACGTAAPPQSLPPAGAAGGLPEEPPLAGPPLARVEERPDAGADAAAADAAIDAAADEAAARAALDAHPYRQPWASPALGAAPATRYARL